MTSIRQVIFHAVLISFQVVLIAIAANQIAKGEMVQLHYSLIGINTFFALLNLKVVLS